MEVEVEVEAEAEEEGAAREEEERAAASLSALRFYNVLSVSALDVRSVIFSVMADGMSSRDREIERERERERVDGRLGAAAVVVMGDFLGVGAIF